MRELFGSMEVGAVPLGVMALRLVAALVLGAVVAIIYRRARSSEASSFTATLVLLSILIAMVTQVIGDNVARAFSLVGALSIVRFRTVVRDTQDTAYVIFAVAVGMAVGAGHMAVASAGIAVVAVAAFAMKRPPSAGAEPLPFRLLVRLGLGHEANRTLDATLDTHVRARQLVGVATVRQGAAIEFTYHVAPRGQGPLQELVTALNRLDGVQGVTLERVVPEAE
jgi:uncharacterized membrane protein YhiD involved in acid resistance